MPELPEVEVLARHLNDCLATKRIQAVRVLNPKSIRDASKRAFEETLRGARVTEVRRRGKYLRIGIRKHRRDRLFLVHLGMTGRFFVLDSAAEPSRHTIAVFNLGTQHCIFEDVRRFGHLGLDASVLDRLGPEPLGAAFAVHRLERALKSSQQAIKVRLMDQSIVAGIGNIYANESLFLAGIDPRTPSNTLSASQLRTLRTAIRRTLRTAIRFGSKLGLDWSGGRSENALFYYGLPDGHQVPEERFHVYDREGSPCRRCGASIARIRQVGRSTYYCPLCQSHR